MKKILILANSASGLYDFRNELILCLLEQYEVHVSLPDEDKVPQLAQEGCKVHHTDIDRRGMNPVRDFSLLRTYMKLIEKIKPDVVLTYTIKPNIYGNICCRLKKIPYIVNITGLGSVFENGGMVEKLVVFLYKVALKNASCVFFQNIRNKEIFENFGIKGKSARLVSGSGVNLDRHCFETYPSEEVQPVFLYVGRVMKEKGIDELLYAARELHKEYPDVVFRLIGNYEEDYKDTIQQCQREGVLELIEYQKEIHPYYRDCSAVIMPSYHEGMSNVILEASATGRPVLASDIPGCQEGFEDGVTGFGFAPRNPQALLEALRKFMELSHEQRAQMGRAARQKMEKEFDRTQVVEAYMDELSKL